MTDSIRELKIAKGLPLANRLKKAERSDKTVLADMGLAALLPDASPAEADRPKPRPRPAPSKRPPANAAWLAGMARRLERIEAAPHKRPRAHLLRAMEPGRAYIVSDLVRALRGVYGAGAIKAQLRFRMRVQGLVERIAAPPGTPHRGPLMHGSPQKDPIRFFYRLTEAGVDERQAVLDRDAAG
jgi:hypothetical protein